LVPLRAQEFGCTCADKTTENSLGQLIGNCLTEDKTTKSFCYVEDTNPVCCQAQAAEVSGHCINYDLCDSDIIDSETSDPSIDTKLNNPALMSTEAETKMESCRVRDKGTNKLMQCEFPFKYKGETLYGCIDWIDIKDGKKVSVNTLKNGKPWCSTKVSGPDREHVSGGGHFGDCDSSCPKVEEQTGEQQEEAKPIVQSSPVQSEGDSISYRCPTERSNSKSAFKEIEGKCYYFQKYGCADGNGCTFEESKNLCKNVFGQGIKGKLFEPTTLDINNEVMKAANDVCDFCNFWVGVTTGDYKYLSNGLPVSFRKPWANSHPRETSTSHCILADSGDLKWYSYKLCSYTYVNTICETTM